MILIKVRSVKGSVIYLFHISLITLNINSRLEQTAAFFYTTITVYLGNFLLMSDVPVITLMFSGVSCA